ncbi:MAG: isoprenyl transferase [Paludibacter sp.]|jgi:undecaprenyl diphosphate synthase|nr:isoprenyl transferase [Paludibacter sp.]
MNYLEQIDLERLPKHIAVIMDGNGRWAQQRQMERVFGHKNGVQSVRETVEASAELGIEYLTLFAFSTENWSRPQFEVDALMSLLVETIEAEMPTMQKNNIRVLSIGDLQRIPEAARLKLQKCIADTANNTRLAVVLALSYSARWEICDAARRIAEDVTKGQINIQNIDNEVFSQYLTTHNIPDPDLLIRTSGELRLSNFLLWQLAYTELFFTDVKWPDFRKQDYYQAIVEFQKRERRFGK